MSTIEDLKELESPETPLFLLECTLTSGDVQRWSTHKVTVNGNVYSARILKHNLFELRSSSDEATDGVSRIAITLANGDSFLSPIERTVGWKGAQLTVKFLFFDFQNGVAASDNQVVFRGVANPPDESTESYLRLSFTNRLSLQRIFLPEVRIQKRCPWAFPGTAAQLTEAVDGGDRGRFSPFYRCGYSAGLTNGVGNLDGSAPFNSCDYTRSQCQDRGMFSQDGSGNVTGRFGGIEFVPSTVLVRSYGEKGSHYSTPLDNQARYNDFVPLIYGTGWYLPPIVFARNDGNLTHTEVLLGAGEMTAVVTVIVNGVEIPAGITGVNMTATGWYNVVTLGTRNGSFNTDFLDASGQPAGDPYGSLACLSVVVPNRISDGRSLPEIEVLVQGLMLARYDVDGRYVDDHTFTNNPAWVLLDVLLRSGWSVSDVDLTSFYSVAAICDELVSALDLHGNPVEIPRYQCNLILTNRRSAADIVRGIRTGAGIYIAFNRSGLLQVKCEDTLAGQQPTRPAGSNSTESLNGGWPAYEFSDDSTFSGILRNTKGQASLRITTRTSADSPNQYTVEFQDEFNEYQQDSLSLVDLDDTLRSSQEITATLTALGIPNFDQANRVTSLQLSKSVNGNTYVDFDTSVRAVDLRPGDLITLTYTKEGWDRQPFRISRIAPGSNYRTASITAQIHDDDWYTASGMSSGGTGRQPDSEVGLPRPLLGSKLDDSGVPEFDISETTVESTDGTVTVQLSVGFAQPVTTMSAGVGIPLVGLNPQIDISGGTLSGGQNLYYGVSSVDSSGAESGLSFLVKAEVPAGTDTNEVTLPTMSFPAAAAMFNVYRGTTPQQLLQIAANKAIAAQFVDPGLQTTFVSPPDINYDHANFYWRIELQTEEHSDIHSPLKIGHSTLHMLPNDYTGKTVRITKGLGSPQERTIQGNTPTTLSIGTPWDIVPDATSYFVVSDSSWQFGATGATSPISFDVPNRAGTTVQISGRSANVRNEECAYVLCTLTRWRIEGAGGSGLDTDVPPIPIFGVSAVGQGALELDTIGFATFNNTRTVNAGTLTLFYWDELQGGTPQALSADLDPSTGTVALSPNVSAGIGDLVQVDAEVMTVQTAVSNAASISVVRGDYGTTASAHISGAAVYLLVKKVFVLPFSRDFFGSLGSGDYSNPMLLPDARIAAAEMFMSNSQGNSDVARRPYTANTSLGLRTLSGGQLSIQVAGILATQTNAAPPLIIDTDHSVRDVFATVGTAPTGQAVQLQITQNGNSYCGLTIQPGSTMSDVVDGFSLGPLMANALIGLNITLDLNLTSDDLTGSDLTVTIRL